MDTGIEWFGKQKSIVISQSVIHIYEEKVAYIWELWGKRSIYIKKNFISWKLCIGKLYCDKYLKYWDYYKDPSKDQDKLHMAIKAGMK